MRHIESIGLRPQGTPRTSDLTEYADRLNVREQIARIDRNQAEIDKLFAESAKLRAEAGKLGRDRSLAPWTLTVTSLGAGAVLFAAAQALFKMTGAH